MKIIFIDSFEDLQKANDYVSKINEACKKLQATADESKKGFEDLTVQFKLLEKEKVDLATQLASFDSNELESVKIELADANKIIIELGQQLEAQSHIVVSDKRIVNIGGEQFYLEGTEMIVPGHGHISAEDLSKNQELLEKLLARESSVLTPVNAG